MMTLSAKVGIALDPFSKSEPIDFRHLSVRDDQPEDVSLFAGLAQHPQRFVRTRRAGWPQFPIQQHLFQDPAIGGIVVDDQHAQIPQELFDWPRRLG